MNTIKPVVQTAVQLMTELAQNHEFCVALMNWDRMKNGGAYLCLFDFDQEPDYVKSLGLSPANAAKVSAQLLELRNLDIDSYVIETQRIACADGQDFAPSGMVNYSVVRYFNKLGWKVTVSFSTSPGDDDEREGPMSDVYYECDNLIIQGT